ncbi:MAG: hypothetical protein RI988_2314 [Pseudomonadota bacterium]|jgi:flagellar hook-associated protein 3 FlgL
MRIASSSVNERSVELIQQRQQAVLEAQEQLVSGRRFARVSDDPTSAARLERALAQQVRLEAGQRALEASRGAMQQAEGSMSEVIDIVQRARELLIDAGKSTQTDAERKTIAGQLRGLRDDLLRVANRDDGLGGFLFGGQGSGQAPFIDGPAGVEYRSLMGQVVAQPGEPLPMTVDGAQAFLRAPTGNGVFATAAAAGNGPDAWIEGGRVVDPAAVTGADYAIQFSNNAGVITYEVLKDGTALPGGAQPFEAGRGITFDGISVTVKGTPATGDVFTVEPSTRTLSIFDTLDRAAQELGTAGRSRAQVAQAVASGLADVDSSLGTMLGVRSQVGTALERVDGVEKRLVEVQEQVDAQKSAAQDIDLARVAADLQTRQTGYDAALKAYSMVQRLSLFDYLR